MSAIAAACGAERVGAPLHHGARAHLDLDAGTASETDGDVSSADDPWSGSSDAAPSGSNSSGVRQPAEGGANCVAKPGPDVPDDLFTDSNCDGIDGDVDAAVFVSPAGSDGDVGSLGAPVRSLQKGIALAQALGKSVYVCNATYDESVSILGTAVSIYGGYDCANGWRRVRDRPHVSPAVGVALAVRGVASPVEIDRISFRAADDDRAGESSIAAVVTDSPSVRFSQVELIAGNAGRGLDGKALSLPPWNAARAANDAPGVLAVDCYDDRASCAEYRPYGACAAVPDGAPPGEATTCASGEVVSGGPGGSGANVTSTRTPASGPVAGQRGVPATMSMDGSVGATGSSGTAPMFGFGHVQDGRYVPDNGGSQGGWGHAGQAGTGGSGGKSTCAAPGDFGADLYLGGGGGEGGYGGCGGTGGNGGSGGGASIALIAERSGVALVWTIVVTGNGGDGGKPGSGQPGQPGGEGGKGGTGSVDYVRPGHSGGHGGPGGPGGEGGPGGGGPSIGIVTDAVAPTLTNVTFAIGRGGLGAAALHATAPDGVSEETSSLGLGDSGIF